MEELRQDLRYAARRLVRSRGFTVLAVVTLALGIGANSAIFSVINAVLLRPFPFPQPEQLDQIHSTKIGIGHIPLSGPDLRQMQEETRAYEVIAPYTLTSPSLTGEGDPVRLNAAGVGVELFSVLGVQPALGRGFTVEEREPGRSHVTILSYQLWQQRFAGDPAVVGRTVHLDGLPVEVVGVMPQGFDFPDDRELWTPLEYGPAFTDDAYRMGHYLSAVGRRRPGVTVEEGATDIAGIAARIEQAYAEKTGFGGTAVSLREELLGDIRSPLLVLLGAVGLVLLIACANVANLLLARAATREGELAVRTALGAQRGRLVRQLLVESMLLGALGGALGLLLSVWGTAWLLELQPAGIPRLDEVGVDRAVVAFTAVISLLTGVLFGLWPAWQITRGDLIAAIREGGRGVLGARASTRMRATLVVVETALAVMLLVGAGLLIRSFARLSAVELGFRSEGVLLFDVSLPTASYPNEESVRGFYIALDERLRGIPGAIAVGASSSPPMSGSYQAGPILLEGEGEPQPGEEQIVQVRTVTPDLLAALGVPVLRGRTFTRADDARAHPVALLTAAAAARLLPGEEVIGRRVAMVGEEVPNWAEVVGVVADVRGSDVRSESQPGVYFPHAQRPYQQMSLVMRTRGDPMRLLPQVREELQALDPNLPLFAARTMEQVVGQSVSQPRFYTLLLSVFAATALVLSAIGIFGVMSYTVSQRTREIGIRMALGAAPRSVLQTVVSGAVWLAIGGVGLGLIGALVGSRLLGSLLYGVSPGDPATLVTVALVLVAVAAIASFLPAMRAVRVDPLVAMHGGQ